MLITRRQLKTTYDRVENRAAVHRSGTSVPAYHYVPSYAVVGRQGDACHMAMMVAVRCKELPMPELEDHAIFANFCELATGQKPDALSVRFQRGLLGRKDAKERRPRSVGQK